mgnify:CR=1 FL=1
MDLNKKGKKFNSEFDESNEDIDDDFDNDFDDFDDFDELADKLGDDDLDEFEDELGNDNLDEFDDEFDDDDFDEFDDELDNSYLDEFDDELDDSDFDEYDEFGDEDYDFDGVDAEEDGIVEIPCPKCSPKHSVWHKLLKPGQNPVAECMNCNDIHSFVKKATKIKSLKIIISRGGDTFVTSAIFDEEELIKIKSERVIDDESGDVWPVIITSIESGEKRVPAAKPKKIDTIWARAIDRVAVNISVRAKGVIHSYQIEAPGNHEYTVGEPITFENKTYPISSIKIRDGRFRKKAGDTVPAKKVKRIYVEEKFTKYDDKKRTRRFLRDERTGRNIKKSFHDNDWKSKDFKKEKTTVPKRKL